MMIDTAGGSQILDVFQDTATWISGQTRCECDLKKMKKTRVNEDFKVGNLSKWMNSGVIF